MPTDPSSPTIPTLAVVLIAFWALVIVPLVALFVRALVRSSYPLGRNPRRSWFVWFFFGLLVLLLPPSGYLTRPARFLLVTSLNLLALTWLCFPLSLLFPVFQIAMGVGWAVSIITIILAVGAMLLSQEPEKDNPKKPKRLMSSDDVVVLDGPAVDQSTWPVEEAEAILADPTPLVRETHEGGPVQTRFFRLAAWVNAYRREGAFDRAIVVLQELRAGASYKRYSTQELLDVLFFAFRADHWQSGLSKGDEHLLRQVLQEVVRRVRSDHPPTFVLPPKVP